MSDGLLLKGSRLVIPVTLRADTLDRIHAGHQGITKCKERAKSLSVVARCQRPNRGTCE